MTTFVRFSGNSKFRPDPKPEAKKKAPPKKIKPMSDKRQQQTKEYTFARKEFLSRPENQKCFVEGCKRKANTVEHTKGRTGFADDWARANDMPLLLDERFWEPCCLHHNLEFETNPELSKKYQQSKIHSGKKIDKSNVETFEVVAGIINRK